MEKEADAKAAIAQPQRQRSEARRINAELLTKGQEEGGLAYPVWGTRPRNQGLDTAFLELVAFCHLRLPAGF